MQSSTFIAFVLCTTTLQALRRTSLEKKQLWASSEIEAGEVPSETSFVEKRVASAWTEDIDRLDSAMDRFYKDVRAMDYVKYTFQNTSFERSVPDGLQKKVAYLFMVKDGVDQHALWTKFFQDATPGSYSIYFHQYKGDTEEAAGHRASWSQFGAHYIPKVQTGWGQLSGVEYALLWEALRDPANAQFVYVSEGHVPLKSASYVYSYLMRESNNSKICFNKAMKALKLARQERKKYCTYRDSLQAQKLPTTINGQQQLVKGRVRKHHQWLVLARRHAVDVIEHGQDALQRHLNAVFRTPLPNGDAAMLGASDEGFVATALLLASEKAGNAQEDSEEELYRYGVKSECTAFVYWRHCWSRTALGSGAGWKSTKMGELKAIIQQAKKTPSSEWFDARSSPAKVLNDTPRDFGRSDSIPTETYMRNLVDTGLLFARKFGKDENGRLSKEYSEDLPRLWDQFERRMSPISDERLARESLLWPVLDVGDKIVKRNAEARVPKH